MSRHALHHLPGIVPFAHSLLRQALQAGDQALDATAGNGHDTVLLAQLVGDSGHVHAFDIQPAALQATRQRLHDAQLASRVTLVNDSHANIRQHVAPGLKAAIFNLGYLPGGDKSLATHADSTVQALDAALALLQPGGVLVVVVYPGHAGGEAERMAVEDWFAALNPTEALAARYQLVNQPHAPPLVLALEKRPKCV